MEEFTSVFNNVDGVVPVRQLYNQFGLTFQEKVKMSAAGNLYVTVFIDGEAGNVWLSQPLAETVKEGDHVSFLRNASAGWFKNKDGELRFKFCKSTEAVDIFAQA